MPTISEVRQQYPQYNDMSDADLASALHQKYYSDMPVEEFNQKIGFSQPAITGTAPVAAGRGIVDKLLGLTGPRYQTFPERAAREFGGAAKSFIEAASAGPPGSREVTEAAVAPAAEIAMQATPLGPEGRIAKAAIPAKSVIPEARQLAFDVLKNEGIEVSAGQARGSSPLRTAESALGTAPFSGDVATEQFNRQMGQFTKAALRRIGEDADRATPEVIDRAFKRIGKEFDRLETNVLVPDEAFKNEVQEARLEYENLTSPGERKPFADKMIKDLDELTTPYGGTFKVVSGETYKSLRSNLARVRKATKDPEFKNVLGGLVEALDGAMERTLEATNPAELGKWQDARRQYRNLMVIENAIPAGEAGAEGLITPAKLRQAAMGQDKRSFRRGKSDFTDLALAGEQLLTPVRTSRTSERFQALSLPAEAGGAAVAAVTGNLPVAAGILATMFGPGLAGRILLSPRFQEWLKSQKPGMVRYGAKTIPQELMYRGGIEELINGLGGRNAGQ